MATKSRTQLEAHFKNGKKPSQNDFADLIGATLNKRDDQFLGRWKAGLEYRPGDVVIHGRALWEMIAAAPICAHDAPEQGETWRPLSVQNDGDWIMEVSDEESGGPSIMYAHSDFSSIGIGTRKPRARLEVQDGEGGRDLLHLGGSGRTFVRMTCAREPEEESTYLLCTLDEARALWSSDAPGGFAFTRAVVSDRPDVLMRIQPDADRQVRVGIGTDEPKAMLDITDGVRGQFLFNPEDKVDPSFSIVNLDPDAERNYLASGVGANAAVFVSDAPDGFVFKQGEEYDAYSSVTDIQQGVSLLTIRGEEDGRARVGVGMDADDVALDVQGQARAFNFFFRTDANDVTDSQPLEEVLDRVAQLNPVRFKWHEDTGLADEGEQIGLVANEVAGVFPELVRDDSDGRSSVAYQNVVPVLIKALTEQQQLIAALQQRLDDLEPRTTDAEQRLDEVESRATDAEQRVDVVESRATDAEQRVMDAEQRLDGLEPRVDALEQQIQP